MSEKQLTLIEAATAALCYMDSSGDDEIEEADHANLRTALAAERERRDNWHLHLGMLGDHAECIRLEYKGKTVLSAGRLSHDINSREIRARLKRLQELLSI